MQNGIYSKSDKGGVIRAHIFGVDRDNVGILMLAQINFQRNENEALSHRYVNL